eukprot:scaffold57647_cov45-Phaeocystis_antarctica.AAC.1
MRDPASRNCAARESCSARYPTIHPSCISTIYCSRACGERPPPSSSASSSATELAPRAATASGWRRSSSCGEMQRDVGRCSEM